VVSSGGRVAGVNFSAAYGIGDLPLPYDNLTKEPSKDGEGGAKVSKSVAEPTPDQFVHLQRLTPVKYCNNPELYLTEACIEYIPCELYEEPESYQIRLSRSYSTFQPFYTHLRNLIIGTALRKDVIIPEFISDRWDSLFSNADLEGHPLQSFAKEIFAKALDGGCAGIFIEYPLVQENLTKQQEEELALRPYFVAIPSEDILGWTSEVSSATLGDKTVYGRKLTSLRLKDEVRLMDPDDEFNELIYPAVNVYDYENVVDEFGGVEPKVRFRQFIATETLGSSDQEFKLYKNSYLSVGIIPFEPVYGGVKECFMIARPLLLDVARLNLHHWATSADLANQLHLTSVPKLVISGVQGGEAEFHNSPNRTLILDKPDASANWIGAPMDGAETTMARIKELEAAMETLAAVAMTNNTTNQAESGFSKLLDRAQSDSLLAVLVQSLEESLNRAIAIAAEYWSEPPIEIALSRDFIPVRLHSQQILAYVELYNARVISHETFLKMLEVGDVFDGLVDFSVQDEISKLGAEPGDSAGDSISEAEKLQLAQKAAVGNGRPSTGKVVGKRPRQAPEAGQQVAEAARPSSPGG
jgi:hypothetical protein